MNELLEKARIDYPIGTKFRSMKDGTENVVTKPIFIQLESIYTTDDNFKWITIYDKSDNQWAEIIKEETMTQQEFNSLRVGEFISNYEILHKYKEFLIVRCDHGHDLFDLNKINKLGLSVKPKTFMGLDIKKYDNVPCEINGNTLVYLVEVGANVIWVKDFKDRNGYIPSITSIRIL